MNINILRYALFGIEGGQAGRECSYHKLAFLGYQKIKKVEKNLQWNQTTFCE